MCPVHSSSNSRALGSTKLARDKIPCTLSPLKVGTKVHEIKHQSLVSQVTDDFTCFCAELKALDFDNKEDEFLSGFSSIMGSSDYQGALALTDMAKKRNFLAQQDLPKSCEKVTEWLVVG